MVSDFRPTAKLTRNSMPARVGRFNFTVVDKFAPRAGASNFGKLTEDRYSAVCSDSSRRGLQDNFLLSLLTGARRTLIATLPNLTIADAATEWGFLHHGRFAEDYHRLFGELPSQTRRAWRTANSPAKENPASGALCYVHGIWPSLLQLRSAKICKRSNSIFQ